MSGLYGRDKYFSECFCELLTINLAVQPDDRGPGLLASEY